jgi:hypothetical protein
MSIKRRLDRLEQRAPAPLASDPWWERWLWFRGLAFAVLEEGNFGEAQALVRQRVEGNERQVFPGKGPIVRNGWDVRLWVMTETVWTALGEFPEARNALEAALQAVTDR